MDARDKILHNDYLALVLRVFVGVVFVYASIDKIVEPSQFARIIYNYHLLPETLINLLAIIMPWVELLCGIVLILGIQKKGSLLLINVMLVVFMVAIGINLFRNVDLECGCFSVSSKSKEHAWGLLLRDIGLLAVGIYLLINRSVRFDLIKSRS
ncbi:MAG: DoxX family membrane protein [candidate division Zixibacteria bacterium]|nr:DoxX family membrane protein [candidate division Zixibacteria bacterium]